MGYLEKLDRSARLAQGMAERVGADLTEHLDLEADTAAYELRRIVLRCASCSDQDGCAKLQSETDTLAEAPGYCMNRDLMRRRQT